MYKLKTGKLESMTGSLHGGGWGGGEDGRQESSFSLLRMGGITDLKAV